MGAVGNLRASREISMTKVFIPVWSISNFIKNFQSFFYPLFLTAGLNFTGTWRLHAYNVFIVFQGLPLHIQVDTYEDPRDETVFHRGYCQIKVFCDKVRLILSKI